MTKSTGYLFTTASLLIASIAYYTHLKYLLVGVLILLWIYCILYSLKKINDRIVLCSFLLTFFAFLLSRTFVDTLLPDFESDYITNAISKRAYSDNASLFILFSLVVSLVGLFVGYISDKSHVKASRIKENPMYLSRVRYISKRLTYLLFTFALLVTLEKVRYIWANGYLSYYLSYRESMPHVFYTLAVAYKFAFFMFLSTMPSKGEAKILILLYVFDACVSLLTGQRGAFITPLLFILIYFFIRNSLSPEDPWLGKKGKIAIAVSFPLLSAAMFLVMLIRGEDETGGYGFTTLFVNFFYQLGGSESIIGYSYDMKSLIPDGQWYSLGPIIRFLKGNPIAYLFGFGETIDYQSVEMATRGHELGSFLTYNTDSYRYLNGGNLASSYVAELWMDFGMIGVFIGNVIYGRILAAIGSITSFSVWKATIAFVMMNRILTAPRGSFAFFITDCLSFAFIVMVIYIIGRCKGIPHYISRQQD